MRLLFSSVLGAEPVARHADIGTTMNAWFGIEWRRTSLFLMFLVLVFPVLAAEGKQQHLFFLFHFSLLLFFYALTFHYSLDGLTAHWRQFIIAGVSIFSVDGRHYGPKHRFAGSLHGFERRREQWQFRSPDCAAAHSVPGRLSAKLISVSLGGKDHLYCHHHSHRHHTACFESVLSSRPR
mgnify:CR=1 FL=1